MSVVEMKMIGALHDVDFRVPLYTPLGLVLVSFPRKNGDKTGYANAKCLGSATTCLKELKQEVEVRLSVIDMSWFHALSSKLAKIVVSCVTVGRERAEEGVEHHRHA